MLSGASTFSPAASATSRIGFAGVFLRPTGGGVGLVTSAATSCSLASSARKVGTAKGPVPIIKRRIGDTYSSEEIPNPKHQRPRSGNPKFQAPNSKEIRNPKSKSQ